MPSSPTARNRLEKQAVGENVNTWGDKLNQRGLDLIDEAMDGVESIAVASTAVTLTSSNYASDQARNRALMLTGALTGNTTVTVPGVEKVYLVDDQTTRGGFTLTLKTSGGAGYALRPGPQWVYCDATDVKRGQPRLDQMPLPAATVDMNGQRLANLPAPAAASDPATRKFVEDTAFAMAAGQLPGQSGSGGKFLRTDGSVAGWADLPTASEAVAGVAEIATQDETDTGTDDARAVTPLKLATWVLSRAKTFLRAVRSQPVALTDGATITPDFAAGNYFTVTLGGNRTLANPTGLAAGQGGSITIRQDDAGDRTLDYGAAWKFPRKTKPVLSTEPNAVDKLVYEVVSPTEIHAALQKDFG